MAKRPSPVRKTLSGPRRVKNSSTKAISRAEAREFDRHAIEDLGVPSMLLMENAARGAADLLAPHVGAGDRIDIYCGVGNNGGDGFAIARHLAILGARVQLFVVGDPARFSPDAQINYTIAKNLGLEIAPFLPSQRAARRTRAASSVSARKAFIIDAIFGTGLARPVEGSAAAAIQEINDRRVTGARVVAIDVPSGMDCDTGDVLGIAVKADLTITFVAPKPGFLTPQGSRLTGRVHVVHVGLPPGRRNRPRVGR